MEELISVIVPVYNVEDYVEKCIESIINQTYKNLEIILVDDGSIDSSGKICDELAQKDKRIRVIHKENGGLSNARNIGMQNAAKEGYYAFVDSDDYLNKEYLMVLYNLMKSGKYKISICNSLDVDEKGKSIRSKKETGLLLSMNGLEALKIMLYQKYYDTSAWGKLFDKNLFSEISFPEEKLFEDLGTIYKIMLRANGVIFLDRKLYNYVHRKNSISGDDYNFRKNDYLEFAEEIYEKVTNDYPALKNAAASRCISVASHLMLQMYCNNKNEYKLQRYYMYNKITKYRKGLIFDKNIRKKNKIMIFGSFMPFGILDIILTIRSKIRIKNI